MSYWTVSTMSADNDLTRREAACWPRKNRPATEDPTTWALGSMVLRWPPNQVGMRRGPPRSPPATRPRAAMKR